MKPIINNFLRSETADIGYYLIFSLPVSDTFTNDQAILKSGTDYYFCENIVFDPFPTVEVNGKTYRINLSDIISAGETKSFSIAVVLNEITTIPSTIDQNWINANQTNLSEWSDVISYTALREAPVLAIGELDRSKTNTLNTSFLTLTGSLTGGNLLWYKIFLRGSGAQDIETSQKIFLSPEDNNLFTYKLLYSFEQKSTIQNYSLNIAYSTDRGYVRIVTYSLEVPALIIDNDVVITCNLNTEVQSAVEQGFIKITTHFENTSAQSKTGELVVSRTTSKDNYVTGKVISNPKVVLNTGAFDYIVIDRLVESGVGYKYTVYFKNENNTVSNSIQTVNPIYCCFEHILLSDSQCQLAVKYNPDISSYKYNIGDTITQTLGSRFPYFRRNGQMKYRTFTIGGLISYHTEEDDLFSNSYSNSLFISTNTFNIPAGLDDATKEIIKEKVFRDKMLDFLYSATPKLFRSLAEGNMIIRLTNVSLTPNKQLGRSIYSFTATATEVEEATIAGCAKYDLHKASISLTDNSQNVTLNNYYILADTISDADGYTVINSNEFDADGSLFVYKETFNI